MDATISESDRLAILGAARQAIVDVTAGRHPFTAPLAGAFANHAGAFVSLHRHGDLRGCIGHIDDDLPLSQVISRCAVAAAVDDPRFPPVTSRDVPDLDIEVSILSGLTRVHDIAEIEVGRHGLIVEQQGRKGLLLPQVATEQRWDRDTFLSHTCTKAGLPPDAWQRGAVIFRFEAEVFGESR